MSRARLNIFHATTLFGVGICLWVANAAVASQYSVPISSVPSTLTDWNKIVSFDQFNGNLGKLTAAQFTLTSHASAVFTITNNSPTSYGLDSAYEELPVYVGDDTTPWFTSLTVIDDYDTADTFSVKSWNGGQGLAPGQFAQSDPYNFTATGSQSVTDAVQLAYFVGNGVSQMSLPAYTEVYTWKSSTDGNSVFTNVTSADLSGTVTYYYTPEPGSLTLLTLGGLAILGCRRRRVSLAQN